MSNLKINENQFIGKQEFNRLLKFIVSDGYKLLFKNGISVYGFVRTVEDTSFDNMRIIQGSSPELLTVKRGYAIDTNVDMISVNEDRVDHITIPTDSISRLIVVSYAETNVEVGKVSIGVDGSLTGLGTSFLEVLRGTPNHPIKIKFPNSAMNTQEYLVSQVASDTSAFLLGASFTAESDQDYSVVGTFTSGIVVPPSSKFIYDYSDALFTIQSVGYVPIEGLEFIVAEVISDGVVTTIIDRRSQNLFNLGNYNIEDLVTQDNPLIGLEYVKHDTQISSKEYTLARVGWGFRASIWSADSANNQINITEGLGGIHHDITTITSGLFNGWRAYFQNGKYLNIISSVYTAGVLTITFEDYDTFVFPTSGTLTLVHQADFVHLSSFVVGEINSVNEQVFPVFRGYGEFRIKCSNISQIQYKSSVNSTTTPPKVLNIGTYLDTASFDASGTQIATVYANLVIGGLFTNPPDPINTHSLKMAWKNRNNTFENGFTNTFSNGSINNHLGIDNFVGDFQFNPLNEVDFTTPGDGNYGGFNNRNHVQFINVSNAVISSFLYPLPGKLIIIRNSYSSVGTLTILNNSGAGDVSGRVLLPGGINMVLSIGEHVGLIYNSDVSRWEYAFGKSSVDTPWITITPSSPFTAGTPAPSYRKEQNGIVRLKGILNATGASDGDDTPAFVLPAGFRPNANVFGQLYAPDLPNLSLIPRGFGVTPSGLFAPLYPNPPVTAISSLDVYNLSSFPPFYAES